MPKMKTKSGAKKRLRPRKRFDQALASVQAPHPHKRTTKNKRQLRARRASMRRTPMPSAMLPYA
jgi:ribosomal protein L35